MSLDAENWSQKKIDVVEATVELVALQGFHRVTTSSIAGKANVGEGTIYRYFKNKEELFTIAAQFAANLIFGDIVKQYDPSSSIPTQYARFCHDFLASGAANPKAQRFMEQFVDSKMGVDFRRKNLAELGEKPMARLPFYPLNRILTLAKEQGVVKEYPIKILFALTMGQLIFILKMSTQDLLVLNQETMAVVSESCWDAIRKHSE